MLNKVVFSVVGLLCLGVVVIAQPSPDEPGRSFIVQGASQDTMRKQVLDAGGEVTHSFAVIEAISAILTQQQVANVKQVNPLLRFFDNATVEVSNAKGWKTNKPLKYRMKKDKVVWVTKNRSDDDHVIKHITLSWPAENGALTKLKVAGKRIKPNAKGIDFEVNGETASIKLKGKKKIKVKAGKKVKVMMQFENLSNVIDGNYQIALTTKDGSVIEMQQQQRESRALPIRYSMEKDQISWNTQNDSDYDQYVRKVTVDWPLANGAMEKLKINGQDVVDEALTGGSAQIDLAEYVQIEGEEDIQISMAFSKLNSVDDLEYDVELEFADRSVKQFSTSNSMPHQGEKRDTFYPSLVNADQAHARGITGNGVTVAIIDTGFTTYNKLEKNVYDDDKSIHIHSVLTSRGEDDDDVDEDSNGHGTHIASVIGNNSRTYSLNGDATSGYNGIAPDADLVIIKAFDKHGRASYADILKAVDYVIEHKDVLNIKVLNLSFSATPSSNYWDDPINQAVMRAWEAGITVLAAAGNQGPEAMSIGVPGNTPYIITVGALSDNYTPNDPRDDFVTSFSSAGPTFEGFVKPEMVAPGGHIQGLMDDETYIGENFGMYNDSDDYFVLSGSSQSTAITSGIVALMLQADPNLSPDAIKCRLMHTAKIAVTDQGELAYSVFQQGAGLVDAIAAIDSTANGCANQNMDIGLDLAGEDHYIGPAMRYENDGDFYVPGTEGMDWNGVYSDAQLWGNRSFVSNAQLWGNRDVNSDAQLWGNRDVNSDAQLWGNRSFNSNAQLWGNRSLNSDSQLWGNRDFNSDSQLWGNRSFVSDSQLWGNRNFLSDSLTDPDAVAIKWVEQE